MMARVVLDDGEGSTECRAKLSLRAAVLLLKFAAAIVEIIRVWRPSVFCCRFASSVQV